MRRLIFCLISILFTFCGFAQTSASQAADSTLISRISAIPVTDIVQNIGETNRQIKQAGQRIEPGNALTRIDSIYSAYADTIAQRKRNVELLMKANPTRQELLIIQNKWQGYRSYLESWLTTINNYLARNSIIAEQFTEADLIWELTYQNAREKKAPRAVLRRTKAVWDDIKALNSSIKSQSDKYLNLETKISDRIAEADQVIEELGELQNSEVYQIFYLRTPPIWKKAARESATEDAADARRDAIVSGRSGLREFLRSNENEFYLFLLCVFLIGFLIWLLRRSFLRHELDNPNTEQSRSQFTLVKNTGPTVVFIALITSWYLFENTPYFFEEVLLLLLLICAALITRPHIHKQFRKLPWAIIAMVVIDDYMTYTWTEAFSIRIYWIVQALAMAGILYYFTEPYSAKRQLPISKITRIFLRVSVVIYFLTFTSVIANVLGYINLAMYTLKICLEGADLTLIFYGILISSEAVVLGITHHYFNRKSSYNLQHRTDLESRMLRIVRLAAFVLWGYYLLVLVDLYEPISQSLADILTEPYKVGSVTLTLGMLLSFVGILAVSFGITSIIHFLIDGSNFKSKFIKLPKGIPAAISLVLRYFILAVGFVLAMSVLGIELSRFNLMAGALGLGIGFGLQNVVSNFISGIILVFERPILPGDIIEVNKLLGTVNKIGVRSSRITTFDGFEVVVPNNNLIANDLINWTLSDNIRRLEILVDTSYASDPNEVLEVLKSVAADHPATLKDPEPMALFTQFGESSMKFRLLYWVYVHNGLSSKSEVSIGVYNEFKKRGIEIPYPQMVLHNAKNREKALGEPDDTED